MNVPNIELQNRSHLRSSIWMKTLFFSLWLCVNLGQSNAAEYIDVRGEGFRYDRHIPATAREEYPELFQDTMIKVIEARRMTGKLVKGSDKIFAIICGNYRKLINNIQKEKIGSESGISLENYKEEVRNLKKICVRNNSWE